MDVPWWVCHYNVEFAEAWKVEILNIAVNPLAHWMFLNLLLQGLLLGWLLLRVMDMLAVRIMTGIQMGAVSHRLISWVGDQSPEVFLCAAGPSQNLQTSIPCTVLAILKPIFVLESIDLLFLFKTNIVMVYLFVRVRCFAQSWNRDNVADFFFELFLFLCLHLFLLLKRYRVWRLSQGSLMPGFHCELGYWVEFVVLNQED